MLHFNSAPLSLPPGVAPQRAGPILSHAAQRPYCRDGQDALQRAPPPEQGDRSQGRPSDRRSQDTIFWIWRARTHLLGQAVKPSVAKPSLSLIKPGNRQSCYSSFCSAPFNTPLHHHSFIGFNSATWSSAATPPPLEESHVVHECYFGLQFSWSTPVLCEGLRW